MSDGTLHLDGCLLELLICLPTDIQDAGSWQATGAMGGKESTYGCT